MNILKNEDFKAMFRMAGIEIKKEYELVNNYWPRVEAYATLILENPWWLYQTPYGMVKVGMRKRVYVLDWSDTSIRTILTEHDVTKDETYLHAWSADTLLEAILALGKKFNETNN